MKACPIKSKAWLNLVNQIGDAAAYKLWVANGYNVPNPKKDLRIRYNLPLEGREFKDVVERLKNYNATLGTEHKLNTFISDKVLYIKGIEENWNPAGVKYENETLFDNGSSAKPTWVEQYQLEEIKERAHQANEFITNEGDVLAWDDFRDYLARDIEDSRDYLPTQVDEFGNVIISHEGDTPVLSTQFKVLRQLPFRDEEIYKLYSHLNELAQIMDTDAKDEFGELILFFGDEVTGKSFTTSYLEATQKANDVSLFILHKNPTTEKYIQVANWRSNSKDNLPEPSMSQEDIDRLTQQLRETNISVREVSADIYDVYDELPIDARTVLKDPNLYRFKILLDSLYYSLKEIKAAEYKANRAKKYQDAQRYSLIKDEIQAQIDELKQPLTGRPENLAGLEPYAENHLNQIEEILLFAEDRSIPLEELLYARRLTNFWMSSDANLVTEEDKVEPALLYGTSGGVGVYERGFLDYAKRAKDIDNKLRLLERNWLTKYVNEVNNKTADTEYSVDSLYKAVQDISVGRGNTLDPLSMDHPIVQTLGKVALAAGQKVHEDMLKFEKVVDEAYEKALPALKKYKRQGEGLFGIFKQRDKFGNVTGDLIQEYSSEAYAERGKKKREIDWKDAMSYAKYYDWYRKNWIMADVRKLFPNEKVYLEKDPTTGSVIQFTDKDRADHIAELEAQLGKAQVEEILESLSKKMDQFKEMRDELTKEYISNPLITTEAAKVMIYEWDVANSPYWAAKNFYEQADIDRTYLNMPTPRGKVRRIDPRGDNEWGFIVPRKYDETGADTGWANKDFEVIRNNEDLFNYYKHVTSNLWRLRNHLPYDAKNKMKFNTLPWIRKTVSEKLIENGSLSGASAYWDRIVQSTRIEESSPVYYGDVDPLTKEKELRLEVHYIDNHEAQIKDLVAQRFIDFKIENNREPDADEKERIRSEAKAYVAENKSWDLPKVLKAYGNMSFAMKHKTMVADELKFLRDQIATLRAPSVNDQGKEETLPNGDLLVPSQSTLKNYLDAVNFQLAQFFGKNKVQMNTGIKVLTIDEKATKKELEDLLASLEANKEKFTPDEYAEAVKLAEDRLAKLGGTIAGSRVIDKLLKYLQLKTLGWNPFSAMTNLSFGQTALMVEASAGEHFDDSELMSAYKIVLKSVGKFWTRGKYASKETIMLRAMMERFRFPAKQFHENSTNPIDAGMNKIKSVFNPFTLTESTEYLNYAPALLATMRKRMVKVVDSTTGEETEISLWDGLTFDETMGAVWNTERYGAEPTGAFTDYAAYISVLEGKIHGNYDANRRARIKEGVGGRMLSTFRTWMFEGWESRWTAPEYYNEALGKKYKARYKSYQSLNKVTGGGIQTTLFLGKQLLNKWAAIARIKKGRVSEFDSLVSEGFTETDAANMRRNLSELFMFMNVMGLYLMLKYGMADEDDDDTWVANMLLNQMFRLQQDMNFYVSLGSIEQLNKNIIPLSGLYNDISGWVSAVHDTALGEGEYETGTFAGHSKLLKATAALLPIAEQPYRLKSIGETLLDK